MKNFDSAVDKNRLGMSYFAEGKFDEAAAAYQDAIDLQPDYTDAYYNLGLALIKMQRREMALHVFEALIELFPEHLGGRFQLGCLLMSRQQYQLAAEQFIVNERVNPQHGESLVNLASCYLKLGNEQKAKLTYLKALELDPTELQTLFNLGVISVKQGRIRDAIEYYSAAVALDPNFYEAQNNLAVVYLREGNLDAAKKHFLSALRIKPQDEVVKHTMDILAGECDKTNSPPAYIRALFDSYADHFDTHLLQSLQYEVPKHLLQLVEAEAKAAGSWEVLDLGCGTGLSGEVFKAYALKMTGVDLSAGMLDLARQKHIYDELVESEVLTYLKNTSAQFDFIIAGDTLVYFGDLADVLRLVAGALKPGGLFVFDVEISPQEEFCMTDSGRFAHRKEYIDKMVLENHLRVVSYRKEVLRTQNAMPVQGHFYLLQKMC